MKKMFAAFTACAVIGLSQNANAAVTYDLALRTPGGSSSFDAVIGVTAGEVLTGVELLLIETIDGGSASIFSDDALFTGTTNRNGNIAAFQANLVANGSDGSFANLMGTSTGGGTGPNDDSDTIAYLSLGNFIFNQPGLKAIVVDPSTREVVIGTVDLTAPTVGQTTFTLADFSPADGDFTTFSTGSLEAAARNSGGAFNDRSLTLSVSAVPEPSSVLAIVVIGGVAVIRRRKRSAK